MEDLSNSQYQILSFKYNYYKNLYESELQRRNQLSDKQNGVITILLALASAFVYMITHISFNINNIIPFYEENGMSKTLFHGVFLYGMVIWFSFLLISVFINFKLCFMKYKSSRINPEEAQMFITKTETNLEQYAEDDLYYHVLEELSSQYAIAAKSFYKETNEKMKHLNKIYQNIWLSIIPLGISFAILLTL